MNNPRSDGMRGRAARVLGGAPSLLCLLAAIALGGCGGDAPDPSGPCTVRIAKPNGDDLDLEGGGSCTSSIRLALRVGTGDPSAPDWSSAAEAPVAVEGAWSLAGTVATRDVTLRNTSAAPVTVVGLEWSTVGATGLAADRFLHDGYQSWSYSGIESVGDALTDERGTAPFGGEDGDVLAEHYGTSWWWTFVSDAAGQGLVMGADGGTVLKTHLAVDRAPELRVRLVEGVTGDRITLAPGEEKPLDGIVVALGDVRAGLESWASRVAELHPPAAPRSPARGGWGSWNLYYADITAQALRDEAGWAAAPLAPLGLHDFLLDDGYEPHWGDWEAATDFGATLPALTAEERAAGLSPALWLAPFYVDTTDPVVSQHPDWFVHDDSGALRTFDNFGPTYAALDPTVPEARDRVTTALQSLRDAGYATLKIDFLFGGALEGAGGSSVTSLEAYALWMKTIREAVPDIHLVGCGAPLLPSVGWVDSMRTGPDIALSLQPEPSWDFIVTQARHTSYRAATDRFWSLDPDVVLLRGDLIDDVEAWTAVVSAAMAGGNYLLGDGRQASPTRLAMAIDPEILAMTRDGLAARPDDVAASADDATPLSPALLGGNPTSVPHLWRKTNPDGSLHWLAVFAWDTDGYAATIDALPSGTSELVPPASAGEMVGRLDASGARSIAVPRHGVRLFVY